MGEVVVSAETKTTAGVVGEVVVEVEKNPGADQQVQHLNHFFVPISHFLFFISQSFFTLPLHQVPRSSVGDSATQSSAPGDNFASVIKDVIHSLEDDPTHKEIHAEASQAKKRPPAVALENVLSYPVLRQNQVLIVCMTQDQLFHTYRQKCSHITKCHEYKI
jgi:hypothetical protein